MASPTADIAAYYSRMSYIVFCSINPILFVMGIVGAILSGIIFSHKSMRQNPGSIYFMANSITSFMMMIFFLLQLSIRIITNANFAIQSLFYCRLISYSTGLCPVLHRYCLVLAAIDRTLITSSNAILRKRSTHRLAYWTISGMTLITMLYHIHILVCYNIYVLPSGLTTCSPWPGTYTYFYAFSNLVINNLIPPCLLSVLAIKTLTNLQRVRIQPTNTDPNVSNTPRSKDHQLAILLLADIAIVVFLQLYVVSLNMYLNITRSQVKSASEQLFEQFLQNIAIIFVSIPPAISFYQNLVISKGFRRKAKEVLIDRFRQQPLHGGTHRRA